MKLSSADRVLFPDDGITKGDIFDYYEQVADDRAAPARPAVHDEALARRASPASSFFQKQAPKGTCRAGSRHGSSARIHAKAASRLVDFRTRQFDREALLWMVQMHCIDMNAWYSRVDKPDRPDFVLFDLDPPDEPTASSRRSRSRT